MSIIVAALILGLISLACSQIPLLNYLGYEFSAIIGVVASFVAAFLIIREVRLATTAPKEKFTRALKMSLVLLIIPLVVMATNALFVKNCSMVEGLAFFVLIPVVSVWFSVCLGFFCAVHYRLARTAFMLFFILTLVYALGLGYYTPAIFSYNFFYGFFPGLTYDEALGITPTLVAFRVLTVLLGGVFFWLGMVLASVSTPGDSSVHRGVSLLRTITAPRLRGVTGAIGLGLVMAFLFRADLGFESPAGYIQKYVGAYHETEHFSIYYSQESYDGNEIAWIAAEHEFRLAQILAVVNLPSHQKIESYIYPSNEVKQRLIGTSTTNIAKPWSGQIHLTKNSLDATLKHELVHVVAARFGKPIIGASLSTGLVEGLAMAIEWNWGNRTLHQYAAAMRRFGVAPDMKRILSFTGFASHSSSISYVLAGSFCRFLIDRYGIRSMMLVYKSGDYETVYMRPLDSLIAEWHLFLDGVERQENDHEAVDVLFRRPAIFDKVCARVIARRNIEARTLAGRKDYSGAAAFFLQSYQEGKGFEAFSGYLNTSLRSGDIGAVRAGLDSVILRDQNPNQYLPLFITAGDACWAGGDLQTAYDLYGRVRFADFSEVHSEAAAVRMHAIRDAMHGELYLRYVLSDAGDSIRGVMLDSVLPSAQTAWLAAYLKGKMLVRLKKYDEAFAVLNATTAPDSLLEATRLRAMGVALFRQRVFQKAKEMFWNSLNHALTPVTESLVYDWVERCEWMDQKNLP